MTEENTTEVKKKSSRINHYLTAAGVVVLGGVISTIATCENAPTVVRGIVLEEKSVPPKEKSVASEEASSLSKELGSEDEGDGDGSYSESSTGCSHTVGGRNGYAVDGCSSGYHCESHDYATGKDGMGPTKTSYSCVSDSPPDYSSGGKW